MFLFCLCALLLHLFLYLTGFSDINNTYKHLIRQVSFRLLPKGEGYYNIYFFVCVFVSQVELLSLSKKIT